MVTGITSVLELWRFPVKSMQGERLTTVHIGPRGIEGDRSFALCDAATGKVLSAKRWGRLLEARARLDGERAMVELSDGAQVASDDRDADRILSEWFGQPVTLQRADPSSSRTYETAVDPMDSASAVMEFPCPPGTFHDAAAVHLMSTASLVAARSIAPDSAWEVRRFRPGVVVGEPGEASPAMRAAAPTSSGYSAKDAGTTEYIEEGWIGCRVFVGGVVLAPFAPTVRCAMTTRAQPEVGVEDGFGMLAALPGDKSILRSLTDHHFTCLGIYAAVSEEGSVSVGDAVRVSAD